MKKLLLSAAIAVLGLTQLNAQDDTTVGFNKGDVFVSGEVSFDYRDNDSQKYGDLYLRPSVGYFVSDHVALELGLNLGVHNSDGNETSQYGARIGAGYYFTPESKFSFFVAGALQYSRWDDRSSWNYDTDNYSAYITPGFNYFVNNKLALRASVGALYFDYSEGNHHGTKYAEREFGLSTRLSNVYFGVTYKL